ncbi:MAG: hypothetical protein WC568_10535 [Candidatus Methanoperedens sp.]
MDPKYKTLIPLIIIFFIFGIVVGYVAHKPQTIEIEKVVYINQTVEKIVTVTVTPTPAPQQAEEVLPKETPVVKVPDIIKLEITGTSVATKTITIKAIDYGGINPNPTSLRVNDTAFFRLYEIFQYKKAILQIGENNFELGTGSAIYLKFTEKRTYNYKVLVPSSDPNIQPTIYAEGTITVY